MSPKRVTFCCLILAILLANSACGGGAAETEAYAYDHDYEAEATEAPARQDYDDDYEGAAGAPVIEESLQSAAPVATSVAAPAQAGPAAAPHDQGPDDVFFEDYGTNPFIDVEDDPLSTFALDVDTGSYTIMRRYVNDGTLPPADSVRVEEYVNYFDQGYPQPSERQAFSINIDGAPFPYAENERYRMIRIGVQGYEVPDDERKDASLTFVIDVSGSMDLENRLGLVKRSLEMLVEDLDRDDYVSIVVYGTEARVVLNPTRGNRTDRILNAIYSLHPEGVTNAEAGLRLGYQMALEAFNPEGINRVILCSDGVANLGETSAGGIWDEIEEYAERGITLTTIGFGMGNYNDTLMEQLADNGDGFYAYVDDTDEARRLFIDELTSTLQVIAMDAKVQVEFNPEVVSRYRLIGFENRAVADDDFRDNRVDAGEVGAGMSATALYEIKLYDDARGRIAAVALRWEDPDSGSVTEVSRDFYTDELAESFREADPHFQWAVIVAEYAEILRESYWAEDSNLEELLYDAERVGDRLYEDEDVREFLDLLERALELPPG